MALSSKDNLTKGQYTIIEFTYLEFLCLGQNNMYKEVSVETGALLVNSIQFNFIQAMFIIL